MHDRIVNVGIKCIALFTECFNTHLFKNGGELRENHVYTVRELLCIARSTEACRAFQIVNDGNDLRQRIGV